jgi:hypothetical protein
VTAKTQAKGKQTNSRTWIWVVAGVAGLALIVLLAISIAGEEPIDTEAGFGEVTVEGTNLPVIDQPNLGDPIVGMEAPTVSGADWDGNQISIEPDGRSKILVLLAHWCPHCQAEVPLIQDWVDGGGLPSDVDLYGITTLTNPLRPEFPPQEWLESEGWTSPTIMDSEDSQAALAYGLSGTPFYVVLDGENRNLGRFSGEIGVAGLEVLVEIAHAGLQTTSPGTTAPAP